MLSAYDACLARDDVDSDRCFALGVSMGGAALALALPDMPEIKAAVLDSAFADLRAMVDHQFRWLPGWARSPMIEMARGIAWLETGADINELMPERAVSRLDVPLLVIHGSEDRIVPVDHARRLSKAGSTKLYIEPDAPHIGTAIFNGSRYRQLVFDHFSGSIEPDTLEPSFKLPKAHPQRHVDQ